MTTLVSKQEGRPKPTFTDAPGSYPIASAPSAYRCNAR